MSDRIAELEAALEQEIANRDSAQEWADRLAYAIAPEAVIGEHSSGNSPWANALAIAERYDGIADAYEAGWRDAALAIDDAIAGLKGAADDLYIAGVQRAKQVVEGWRI